MQAVCQHTAISLCVWVQLICNLSLSNRALSKLVVSSLYSYINVRLLSAYVLLQLNCCPLETTSLFLEESLRFCWDSDCNDTVTDVRQVATDFFFPNHHRWLPLYHKQIACNCQLNPIHSQTDSRQQSDSVLSSFCHCLIAPKLHWRQQLTVIGCRSGPRLQGNHWKRDKNVGRAVDSHYCFPRCDWSKLSSIIAEQNCRHCCKSGTF